MSAPHEQTIQQDDTKLLGDYRGQCGFQFVGFEAEGAGFALVDYLALVIDEVQAIGPAGVGGLGGITELIENGGQLDSELADAGPGYERAFFFALGAGEDNLVLDIALHLPDVAGMRLGDVNDQECDLIVVFIVELVEGRNLPPEGRSSVASENEYDGLVGIQG
jgi:hypothetical protein